jgi:outer membrane receptor protein involved in Fe transport
LDILVKRDDVKLALQHPKIGDFEGEVGVEATEKAQFLRSGHLSPNAKVSKRAIYVFEEADYDRWLVQFGARYDWHDVKAPAQDNEHFVESGVFDASNDQRQFEVMTGSLGATYRLTPNWSVAGNVARGFRAPSIFELYAGGEHGGVQAYQLGNPDLKAETALNTDLSLRWQTLKTQMVATVYQNWIDNYIYLANTGNYRYTEAAIEEGLGAEGDIETSPGEGLVPEMQSQQTNAQIHGVELSVNHRFNQAWSTDAALEVIAGRDTKNSQNLPLMPANNLRLGAHYQPQDWSGLRLQKISVGVKMVDAQNSAGDFEAFSQFDDLPFGRASTDAYALWNVGYQAQVKLERQTVQLGVRVENLFDTDYVDFLNTYKGYTLNQGRNVQLSARMSF